MNNLGVQIVLRKEGVQIPSWYQKLIDSKKTFETKDKIIIELDKEWQGFIDGTIIMILKTFQESVYVALYYLTDDVNEIVTDFEDNKVEKFEVVFEGKKCLKYVKKRLLITKIISEEDGIFRASGYVLNLKFTEPITQVLDLYSVGKETGITAQNFLKTSVR